MSVSAAVTTAKGAGAISTIELAGDEALAILEKIFKPARKEKADFTIGSILVGTIAEAGHDIDQVAIGCEADRHFAIHCHGNPLITEAIMKLLKKHNATLLTNEQFFSDISNTENNTIAIEAKIELANIKTLFATKLILNQANTGLVKSAKGWLKEAKNIEKIKAKAAAILKKSENARIMIAGCKAVIAGPANSGKSSLLNLLCGKDKAIVTDIEGTTRDYVAVEIVLENLFLELTDTAGIDEIPALKSDAIEKTSQKKSLGTLENADLVLFVLDSSKGDPQLQDRLIEAIADKKIIAVLNKSDLPSKLTKTSLPIRLDKVVSISIKTGEGIDALKEQILRICCVDELDIYEPIAFTPRQRGLLKQLSKINSADKANLLITELLKGQLNV